MKRSELLEKAKILAQLKPDTIPFIENSINKLPEEVDGLTANLVLATVKKLITSSNAQQLLAQLELDTAYQIINPIKSQLK